MISAASETEGGTHTNTQIQQGDLTRLFLSVSHKQTMYASKTGFLVSSMKMESVCHSETGTTGVTCQKAVVHVVSHVVRVNK